MRMKITLQNLNPSITNKKHVITEVESNDLKAAVTYALKKEFGVDAEIGKYELTESKHHHCDLFAVIDVNYRTYGYVEYMINVNGEGVPHKKAEGVRVTSKVRVEILEEKKKLSAIKSFFRELRFSFKAKREFRN